MKRSTTVLLLLSFVIFSCSGPVGPGEVIEGYLKAHNANNVENVMNWFHEDATLHIPGQPPIPDIRKAEAWDAAINSRLEYEDWDIHGDTVVIGRITERNNWFAKAGIPMIEYQPGTRIIVRDGKISRVEMSQLTAESMQAMNRMYESFFTWLNQTYPGKLSELMPSGELDVSEDMASKWFELLDEWQRSK